MRFFVVIIFEINRFFSLSKAGVFCAFAKDKSMCRADTSQPPVMDPHPDPVISRIRFFFSYFTLLHWTHPFPSVMMVLGRRMLLVGGIFNGSSIRIGSQNVQQKSHYQDSGHHEETVIDSNTSLVWRGLNWGTCECVRFNFLYLSISFFIYCQNTPFRCNVPGLAASKWVTQKMMFLN